MSSKEINLFTDFKAFCVCEYPLVMASVKCLLIISIAVLAIVNCTPIPGGFGKHHTHIIVHVPHHIHTVHHTHVKKIHVPVPIVKTVLLKEEPIDHGWAHGGWYGSHAHSGWW